MTEPRLTRVDAKIELIRVKIAHEIERLKATPVEPGSLTTHTTHGRINGLNYALRIIQEVEQTVR